MDDPSAACEVHGQRDRRLLVVQNWFEELRGAGWEVMV